jgi:hypothetical protein
MTEQERSLIQSLADRLRKAPQPEIDPEADELIQRMIGTQPNALYLLAQTVLLQEAALNQQKSQSKPSFLGNAPQPGTWGRDDRLYQEPRKDQAPSGEGFGGAWRGNYRASSYNSAAPPTAFRQAAPPQTEWTRSQVGSRGSSFLESAAQTAAGVIAGQVAFSALSSLFGGHHHHGGFFGDGGWGTGSGDLFSSDVSDSLSDGSFDGDLDSFDV